MKTSFRKSFLRDLKKIKDKNLLKEARRVIEAVKGAECLQEIGDLKKLSGADDCYRIRLGDYRIGIVVENEEVQFIRFLHRRDLYKFFP